MAVTLLEVSQLTAKGESLHLTFTVQRSLPLGAAIIALASLGLTLVLQWEFTVQKSKAKQKIWALFFLAK